MHGRKHLMIFKEFLINEEIEVNEHACLFCK